MRRFFVAVSVARRAFLRASTRVTGHGKMKRNQPTRVTKPKITGAWPSEERGAAKVIALPVVKVVIAPIGLDSLPGPCVRGPGS
jgi:hypothetical protein